MPVRFILIDDDYINNLLSSIVIEEAVKAPEIKAFEDPQLGFEYIRKQQVADINATILFLDINMPKWSGWDFLDHYEALDGKIKSNFKIYMLSSSPDPADQQRAVENTNVADYIEKPLCENHIFSILETLNG